MKMLQQLFALQSCISAKKCRVTKRLFEIETLETRVVFAYVSGGSLVVDGTNAADFVTVSDARTYFRVSENGWVQNFSRAAVTTGQFYFRGNGGDDNFSASTN